MKILHQQLATQSTVTTEKLFKLERCGRYEDALDEIKEFWNDFSVSPNVKDFEPRIAAEMLLRCGSLLGFWGHNNQQFPNSQQTSKNILTNARSRFIDFNDLEKVAECENYLALADWRTNEINEAEIWLEESLAHPLKDSSKVRIYSYLIKSLLLLSKEDYSEIVNYCKNSEAVFRNYGDAFLNGSFCTNLGISYNELGNRSEALRYFELAHFFHQKSQHKVYLGTVENNLAQLYKLEKRFAKAHSAIDNATKLFKKIKDKTREGFSFDTKAQIFLAERKFAEALQTVEKAITVLKKSENLGYLVETLMTKTKILLYLNEFSNAIFCLFDAVNITRQQSGELAAQKLVQDFETALQERNKQLKDKNFAPEHNKSENLELVFPLELAHYNDIRGIWIKNSHLEKIGLTQGSMAIVAKGKVERGDLTAILEKETDEVSCGFYDADFGIVCLTGIDSEPQLFDENDIQIIGKIIGVCDSEKGSDGKMNVSPIIF